MPTGIRHCLVPQNDTGAGLIILRMKRVVKFFDNMIYQLSIKYFCQQNDPMFRFLNTIPCKRTHPGRIEGWILIVCAPNATPNTGQIQAGWGHYFLSRPLCERGYIQNVLLSLRSFPVIHKFLLVNRCPFDHKPLNARRQVTRKDR